MEPVQLRSESGSHRQGHAHACPIACRAKSCGLVPRGPRQAQSGMAHEHVKDSNARHVRPEVVDTAKWKRRSRRSALSVYSRSSPDGAACDGRRAAPKGQR